ncbi:MAG TPA: peptide synthase [Candidatus Hydrogenedentes bacterium]|nr:peptide synthase [Candidatus Hydrogenedentota bacterium]
MEHYNIAQGLADMAARAPFRPGIILPAGRDPHGRSKFVQLSFRQMDELCDRYAHGLSAQGVVRGRRVLMLVRPGTELIAVCFALLKIGAVPVLIDPGMGLKAFLQCVSEAAPQAMIAIPVGHLIRRLFGKSFKTVQRSFTVGRRAFPGTLHLERVCPARRDAFPVADTALEEEAAIAFTSGGTGVPKGVLYLHGMFREVIRAMREDLDMAEGEVHLAAMYIFALFNPALGVTTVIPDMDARKTAQVNPAWLVEAIQTHGVTMSMGSPTIWKKVNRYCLDNGIRLPSIKHIFIFGAPVAPAVIRELSSLFDGGKACTPYGATEALPVTNIAHDEILGETAAKTENGAGVCVGRPVSGVTLRIIPVSDDIIEAWDDALALPTGAIGEVVVKGAMVTREYLNRPQETAKAKIYAPDGVWHRMGDIGYLDEKGRLWFCGRKAHRVETEHGMMLPVPCESIFNRHPKVARAALVGVGEQGKQRPVLIVELLPEHARADAASKAAIVKELLELGAAHEHTRAIKDVLFHPAFPVDIRHNAKIQRQELARWAAKGL